MQINLISPFLLNKNHSIFMKESYSNATKIPLVRNLFEKIPQADVLEITQKYNKTPSLYDDMYQGKIKLLLKGITDSAVSVVDKDSVTTENYKRLLGRKSMANYIIKIFDSLDKDKKTVNRIEMQTKNNRLKIMTFGFDLKGIDEFNLPIIDNENPFIKIMNYADNNRIDIIREP